MSRLYMRGSYNRAIKDIRDKIQTLQNDAHDLILACRNTGNFDSAKYDEISKQIEWQEYLLWGAENGIPN